MNDPPPVPPASPSGRGTDTASRVAEATAPPPDSGLPATNPTPVVPRVPFVPGAEVLNTIGGYAFIKKLGEGGMGEVYLAEDTKLGRKVALKLMKPELASNPRDRGRFLREASAAAAVESDHIVPILHIGEAANGAPFIAMPFLQGEMLDARLAREPVASLGLVLKVAREVAGGLAAAHYRGLIHRDIKPGNIWLEGDPSAKEAVQQIRRCKILDFGLARSVKPDAARITSSGAILGTPAFMAPEQARGEKVDHRADLFSLGATLYRLAAGKLPFDGPTPMAVLIALAMETPPPVHTLAPHLPPELADLIDRLMRKDASARPQSAAEVVAAVRKIIKELKERREQVPAVRSLAPPPLPEELAGSPQPPAEVNAEPLLELDDDTGAEIAPKPPPPERHRLWIVAAAIGLFALVLLGVWLASAIGGKKAETDVAKNGDAQPGGPPKKGHPSGPKGTPNQNGPAQPDADRGAAKYILSHGGEILINNKEPGIKNVEDLPEGPFKLTVVLINDRRINDEELGVFANCTNLEHLDIGSTAIGDEGVAHFRNCKKLRHLDLGNTRVSDASVATIKGFTDLKFLQLQMTKVSPNGIVELQKALPNCRIPCPDRDRQAAVAVVLNRGTVQINGENKDIQSVDDLPDTPFRLTALFATGRVNEADLSIFQCCENLTKLHLTNSGISGQGITHFKASKNLQYLDLSGTKMDDDYLRHVKYFKKLTHLRLYETNVTEKGVNELAEALPACQIEWDKGTIKRKKK